MSQRDLHDRVQRALGVPGELAWTSVARVCEVFAQTAAEAAVALAAESVESRLAAWPGPLLDDARGVFVKLLHGPAPCTPWELADLLNGQLAFQHQVELTCVLMRWRWERERAAPPCPVGFPHVAHVRWLGGSYLIVSYPPTFNTGPAPPDDVVEAALTQLNGVGLRASLQSHPGDDDVGVMPSGGGLRCSQHSLEVVVTAQDIRDIGEAPCLSLRDHGVVHAVVCPADGSALQVLAVPREGWRESIEAQLGPLRDGTWTWGTVLSKPDAGGGGRSCAPEVPKGDAVFIHAATCRPRRVPVPPQLTRRFTQALDNPLVLRAGDAEAQVEDYLAEKVIPELVASYASETKAGYQSWELTEQMRNAGVPFCYSGKVRQQLGAPRARMVLLVAMTAHVVSLELDRMWSTAADTAAVLVAAVDMFNLCFDGDEASEAWWRVGVKLRLLALFPDALDEGERLPSTNLRKSMLPFLLYKGLTHSTGVCFRHFVDARMAKGDEFRRLVSSDVEHIRPLVSATVLPGQALRPFAGLTFGAPLGSSLSQSSLHISGLFHSSSQPSLTMPRSPPLPASSEPLEEVAMTAFEDSLPARSVSPRRAAPGEGTRKSPSISDKRRSGLAGLFTREEKVSGSFVIGGDGRPKAVASPAPATPADGPAVSDDWSEVNLDGLPTREEADTDGAPKRAEYLRLSKMVNVAFQDLIRRHNEDPDGTLDASAPVVQRLMEGLTEILCDGIKTSLLGRPAAAVWRLVSSLKKRLPNAWTTFVTVEALGLSDGPKNLRAWLLTALAERKLATYFVELFQGDEFHTAYKPGAFLLQGDNRLLFVTLLDGICAVEVNLCLRAER